MSSPTEPVEDGSRGWSGRVPSLDVEPPWSGGANRNMGYVRLRGEFEAYREEFDSLVAEAEEAGVGVFFWKDMIDDMFEKIDEALGAGNVEDGWRYFHAAQRIETHGLEALDAADSDSHALETRARAVRREALDELGGWRRQAVEDLLGKDDLQTPVAGEDLREASRILHDQYENVHFKRRYLQLQFTQLFWLGIASSLLFLVLSTLPYFAPESDWLFGPLVAFLEPPFDVPIPGTDGLVGPNVSSAGFAVYVGLAGVIGASLFGMRSLQNQTLSMKVAQRVTGFTLTWARGLIGAISALLFYFLLGTPFVTVGDNSAAAMLVVGFAAGYSERMVARAVETVATVTTEPTDSPTE